MIELTPAVILSLVTVLALMGSKIWALGAKVESAATREEILSQVAAIRKDFEIAIKDRTKDSVQEHANLASKSALTEVKADIFDFKKEVNNELKEIHASLNTRFQLLSDQAIKTDNQLLKILHYVSPKGGNHE